MQPAMRPLFCFSLFTLLVSFAWFAPLPAQAHDGHAELDTPVMPASQDYHVVIPGDWYATRRFDQPVPDEANRLYIAETELIFEGWRDGLILGPVLQIISSPARRASEDGPFLTLEEQLEASSETLARFAQGTRQHSIIGGYPAITIENFPYRGTQHSGLTIVQVEATLYFMLYAAHDAEHLRGVEQVARTFTVLDDDGVVLTELPNISALLDDAALSPDNPVDGLVGQVAPDFNAPSMDGDEVALADYRGQTVIVSFWATWCRPCQRELPLLQEAMAQRDDVTVLAVNYREAPGVIRQFTDEFAPELTVLLDRSGFISELYEVQIYPTTLVLDAEGIVQMRPIFEPDTTLDDILGWIDDVQSGPVPVG